MRAKVNTAPLRAADVLAGIAHFRAHPDQGIALLTSRPDLARDPRCAALLCECALLLGEVDIAARAVAEALDPGGTLKAHVLLMRGAPAQALAALDDTPPDDAGDRARYFGLCIRAAAQAGQPHRARAAAAAWQADLPHSPMPRRVLDRWLGPPCRAVA